MEGHDLCLLSHTLHEWGEHDVRRLLEHCFDALAPGGWLVDHDAHINRDKTGPLPVARYSVLLMHTTAGKCWSVAELEAMVEQVGFGEVDERPAAPDRSVVVARKPRRPPASTGSTGTGWRRAFSRTVAGSAPAAPSQKCG